MGMLVVGIQIVDMYVGSGYACSRYVDSGYACSRYAGSGYVCW